MHGYCEHVIDVGDALPIHQKCYHISKKIEAEIYRQVDDLHKRGVIIPSKSEWASLVVIVKKEAYDEEGLKERCLPIPNLELTLNKLQNAMFVSTIDLSKACHQISMAVENRHITAFVVPGKGIFELTKMVLKELLRLFSVPFHG